jgi:hypothetical protein
VAEGKEGGGGGEGTRRIFENSQLIALERERKVLQVTLDERVCALGDVD